MQKRDNDILACREVAELGESCLFLWVLGLELGGFLRLLLKIGTCNSRVGCSQRKIRKGVGDRKKKKEKKKKVSIGKFNPGS